MRFYKLIVALVLVLICTAIADLISTQDSSSPLPGMPPVHDANNIYSDAGANMFSSATQGELSRVYVPNGLDNTVSVIDPAQYKVINTLKVGLLPQHVVPAYDLKTLWVVNNNSGTMTAIDPRTATSGISIPVNHPYNLYYTPDGRYAIEVSEAHKELNFYATDSMKLHHSIPIECNGINHIDFTANGRFAIATCEFSGKLVKLDIAAEKVIGYLSLEKPHGHSMPQDIRSSPDGKTFFVADMMMNGVVMIDPNSFTQIGFIPTGIGAHGVYPSRDGKLLYVSNRGCSTLNCHPRPPGSVSVIDPYKKSVVAKWNIPGGGSPDMGNVSADGKELWLAGRYDSEVYVFDTATGTLTHRIAVGRGPHGLTVWPQPGRYSLGHTGNMR